MANPTQTQLGKPAAGPLTFAQLEQLWTANGGDPTVAPTMAAIALAESSGNPSALNATDNNGTQSSYGLWQISTGTHAAPSPSWADPNTNAALAVQKYATQGLGAWGTYTSGIYKQFLSSTAQPVSAGSSVTISGSTDWSKALLTELGAPLTQANVDALNAWQTAEGQWSSTGQFNTSQQHNPLNLETDAQGLPGAPPNGYGGQQICDNNGACTWSYPDYASGIAGTVAYLSQPSMANVLAVLKAGGGLAALSAAVVQSGWGTGPFAGSSTADIQGAGQPQTATLTGVPGGSLPVIGPLISGAAAANNFFGDLTSPTFWRRILMGAAGVALITGGVVIFLASTKPGQETISSAPALAAAVAA